MFKNRVGALELSHGECTRLPLDRSTALILHNDVTVGETIIDAPPSHSVDDFNQAVLSAHSEIYCHPDDLDGLEGLELPDSDRPLIVRDGGWMKVDSDGVNKPPARRRHRRYRRQKKLGHRPSGDKMVTKLAREGRYQTCSPTNRPAKSTP